MESQSDYRRTKSALAFLAALIVALYVIYQLVAVGRVSWLAVGLLVFLVLAGFAGRILARQAEDHGSKPTPPN